ncbi:MAG: MBL fold metallo-hydrolase [Archangium sp.]|nr:MBL fold metallo-hydrolase [Archangium sp.]
MRPLIVVMAVMSSGCFPETASRTVGGVRVVTLQYEYTNAHALIGPEGQIVLVDSGFERNTAALERGLKESGLDAKQVVAVVLTHGHPDHAGGAKHFQEQGAVVIAGAGDAQMLSEGKNEVPLCPTNGDARARLAADQAEHHEGVNADVLVTERLSLLARTGVDAEVMPVAGHTPGSLVVKAGQSLFVGDLLRGSVFGSDAEVHFYMCDLEDNVRDVQGLLAEWPEVSTWFVGHFGPLTRGAVEAKFARGQ